MLQNCKENRPEKAAKDFCRCLDDYKYKEEPLLAFDICEAKIFTKYRELQYYYFNCRREGLYNIDTFLKNEAIDFEEKYFQYKVIHCCEKEGKCLLKEDIDTRNSFPIIKEYFSKRKK
jgi:hypothetical protein